MQKSQYAIVFSGISLAAAIIVLCTASCIRREKSAPPTAGKPAVITRSDENTNIEDTLSAEETVRKKGVRIVTSTYLHTKSNIQSDHIALLQANSEYLLIDERDEFYKIRLEDESTGWVLKNKCESFEKEMVVRHIPQNPTELPYSMSDTVEGEQLGMILHENGTVGASVAIIKDGKVVYHYEFGYANKEDLNHPIRIKKDTKYRVASISKVFTSMLAMAEVDDGTLDLDKELSDYFGYGFYNPQYPNTPLTMRMLLTHTAGLSAKEGLYSEDLSSVSTGEEYYISKPGCRFAYSNLGVGIAGAVVEKAADKTISQYARDRFFAPMGIDASYDGSLLSDPSLVADCYNNGRHKRSNEALTKPVGRKTTKPGEIYYVGQGNLLISAIDLAKVSTILLNGGRYEGKKYLRSETVKQMLTACPIDTKSDFEQCIGIRKYAGLVNQREMYYHTGNYYGILALLAIDPNDKSGVIVITSGAHPEREENTVFKVCNDVLAYCYNNIL